jgi:hypothetical protein
MLRGPQFARRESLPVSTPLASSHPDSALFNRPSDTVVCRN